MMFTEHNHMDAMARLVLFYGLQQSCGLLLLKDASAYEVQLLEQAGCRRLQGDLRSAVVVDGLLLLDNPFTRLLAERPLDQLPPELSTAALKEVALLQQSIEQHDQTPQWLREWPLVAHLAVDGPWFANYRDELAADFCCISPREALQRLADAYQRFGVGQLCRFTSFRWQGQLVGVSDPDPITLDDLVGCEHQKAAMVENTEGFLRYHKGNNILLYGERGTGKSSMIKAIANAYREQGLRLIELGQSQVGTFHLLLEELRRHQEKHFIVYLDDLSFDRGDSDYRSFKAILDGGASVVPANVLLYATSNRRHLVHESWQDRQGSSEEVRKGDTMAEKLSLSDRFGMTLVFASPAQEEYLNIVRAIAAKEGIAMPDDLLCKEALEWTMWHNARSGRTARQFINHLQGKGN